MVGERIKQIFKIDGEKIARRRVDEGTDSDRRTQRKKKRKRESDSEQLIEEQYRCLGENHFAPSPT